MHYYIFWLSWTRYYWYLTKVSYNSVFEFLWRRCLCCHAYISVYMQYIAPRKNIQRENTSRYFNSTVPCLLSAASEEVGGWGVTSSGIYGRGNLIAKIYLTRMSERNHGDTWIPVPSITGNLHTRHSMLWIDGEVSHRPPNTVHAATNKTDIEMRLK